MSVLVCFVECQCCPGTDTGYFLKNYFFDGFFGVLLLVEVPFLMVFFPPFGILILFGFALFSEKKLLSLMEYSNG